MILSRIVPTRKPEAWLRRTRSACWIFHADALAPAPHIELRRYRSDDCAATLQVFRQAVYRGAAQYYAPEQLDAWAPAEMNEEAWRSARARPFTWIAEVRGEVVGFCDSSPEGVVGMLYVHPDHARRGLGAALLDEAERTAREAGLVRLHAAVSLAAESVFIRTGYTAFSFQTVERRGETLINTVMENGLEPV